MNLYLAEGVHRVFGLELAITETGITYTTRTAYKTAELQAHWAALATNSDVMPVYSKAPTPDVEPLWTTDTYSIYAPLTTGVPVQTVDTQTINFSDIQSLSDFSDHGLFLVYAPQSPQFIYSGPPPVAGSFPHVEGGVAAVPIHNAYSQTTASKLNPIQAAFIQNNVAMIAIAVPFADAPVDQWSIFVRVADKSLLKVTSGQELAPLVNDGNSPDPKIGNPFAKAVTSKFNKVYFKSETATVTADGFVDLEFFLGDANGAPVTGHDATVYFKTTAGALNKQQATTQNGVGTVRLIATHLTAGDTAKVSCGFKYVSGTDDCVVTVQ
jgi:hypothetical protein